MTTQTEMTPPRQRFEASIRRRKGTLCVSALPTVWLAFGALAATWGAAVSTSAWAQTAVPVSSKATDAGVALQRGDLDQAILLYNAALDDSSVANDRRAVLLAERGVALMQRRMFKAALDDFNKAVVLYPEYAATYVDRGNLLLIMGQGAESAREAIRDFDRAIALSPNLAAAYGNRGAAQIKLGAPTLAIVDFNRAIMLQPQNPAALNGRGRARMMMGQTGAAMRDFSRAITINSGFAQGYRNRAGASMRLGKPTDAVTDMSRALAFDARRVDDYVTRGKAYLASGNATAAMTDFSKVIELDAKSVEGHIGLGLAKATANMPDDAIAALSRAIELEPRSARAYAVRAWVYVKNQQSELGQKDVDRALRLEPVTADAYWADGELKEAAADREAATAAYSRALGLDIDHRETLAAIVRLGLEPQRNDTPIAEAGGEGWRVTSKTALQFTASHPQFPNLRVPLEMMGTGQPKITGWERQKSPYAGYGLLHYTAGTLPAGAGTETVGCTAIIDLADNSVLGVPVTKLGTRVAKFTWSDEAITVVGADGLSEVIGIGAKRALRDSDDGEKAAKRSGDDQSAEAARGGAWQTNPRDRDRERGRDRDRDRDPPSRQASSARKPKNLFDLIFGN